MSGEIVDRMSEDDWPYKVRQTPCQCTFTNLVDQGQLPQAYKDDLGFEILHLHIRSSEIQEVCLPLDANPREPTRADVVKKMSETLRDDPQRFHHWNNGITVICNELVFAHGKINIAFLEGDGICNGGHTYFSIVTFPTSLPDNCLVHVEFIVLPQGLETAKRNSVINAIAARRNRNRALMPTTQADFLGFYGSFQSALGENSNHVSWHEGDSSALPSAIKSELLIRMLACLDPFWFQHPINAKKPNHKKAATSSAAIHSTWFESVQSEDPEGSLAHMAPLLPECLELRESLSYSLKHDNFGQIPGNFRLTSFYKNWLAEKERDLVLSKEGSIGADFPNPGLIMLLGAFRTNVWIGLDTDGRPFLTGWLIEPITLWEQTKCDYLKGLLNDFGDAGNDPGTFIKNSSPYEHQLLSIQYGRQAPSIPCRFYNSENKCWWVASPSGEIGLVIDSGSFCAVITDPDRVAKLKPEQRFARR